MKIVVTGSASRLARSVIPSLLAYPAIEHIVGMDLKPATLSDPRFEHHTVDIRSPEIGHLLAGAAVLIHLAFVVMRSDLGRARRDRVLMHAINVEGSTRLFEGAVSAGINTIVHCSSASVYRPGAPHIKLTEGHERTPIAGFPYAEDKAELERWLDRFEPRHPHVRIVRMRPHAIVGPNAQPLIRRIADAWFYPHLPDPQPLIQCVHEDDVAQAIALASVRTHVTGAFNLSTDDASSLRALIQSRGFAVALPMPAVALAANVSWQLFGVDTDPSWVNALRYSCVLDNTRARTVLGWIPVYPRIQDCISDMRRYSKPV